MGNIAIGVFSGGDINITTTSISKHRAYSITFSSNSTEARILLTDAYGGDFSGKKIMDISFNPTNVTNLSQYYPPQNHPGEFEGKDMPPPNLEHKYERFDSLGG